MSTDLATELESLAQNDYMIDGHFLPDGLMLYAAAAALRENAQTIAVKAYDLGKRDGRRELQDELRALLNAGRVEP